MTNYKETQNILTTLKLNGMSNSLEQEIRKADKRKLSYLLFLKNILETEIKYRTEKRLKRNFAGAHFPVEKQLKNFEFKYCKGITKKAINELLDFRFIDNHENILLLGSPGIGKTHLSIALGYEALRIGYTVCFEKMTNLIKLLKTVEIQRASAFRINRILKTDLLIIDEIGYTPIDKKEANYFFNLISELYERNSIIISSNKPFEDWAEMLGDKIMTTALLDRILHRAHIFSMSGESYRIKNLKKSKKEV